MTLSGAFGVPRETVTAITGHQEGGRMVRKYMKIDKDVMLVQMEKAWRKLYQDPNNPNTEENQITENEKLKKEIEKLKKIIELQSVGAIQNEQFKSIVD